MDSFFAVLLVAFLIVCNILMYEQGRQNTNQDIAQNCLTYHQELPYNKAIETCEVILKGDKK